MVLDMLMELVVLVADYIGSQGKCDWMGGCWAGSTGWALPGAVNVMESMSIKVTNSSYIPCFKIDHV